MAKNELRQKLNRKIAQNWSNWMDKLIREIALDERDLGIQESLSADYFDNAELNFDLDEALIWGDDQ